MTCIEDSTADKLIEYCKDIVEVNPDLYLQCEKDIANNVLDIIFEGDVDD